MVWHIAQRLPLTVVQKLMSYSDKIVHLIFLGQTCELLKNRAQIKLLHKFYQQLEQNKSHK